MTNRTLRSGLGAAAALSLLAVTMVVATCLAVGPGCSSSATTSATGAAAQPAKSAPGAAVAPAAGKAAPAAGAKAAAATATAASPLGAAEHVQRYERLANGLRVVVREQHIGGVASFRIYLGAGSLNEAEYTGAGISHLLEHVVSGSATPTRTEDQVRAELAAIGAQTNAHTSKQFVCYHGQVSADQVSKLIEIISDYVMNPKLEQKSFDREFEVVQRELERGEANPDVRLWRLADETFFLNHPARYPVIGYLAPLRQLKRDDCVRYYDRVAVPDNAVAVAVGDFDANAVFETIRKAMGSWPRRPAKPTILPERDRQVAPRRAEIEMDVSSVRSIIAYPTVELTHPDLYPLDILAFILGEGRASRMVADLQEKRGLVTSISVDSMTPAGYDGGQFAVSFQAEPAKAAAARQAVMEHLARAIREKPTAEELARAKRQKIGEHVFGLQGCESIATDLGTNALLLDAPNFSDDYVRNIQQVTAEDVQRVAAAYIKDDVLTAVSLTPKQKAAEAAPPAPQGQRRPPIVVRSLPNGVKLLLCPVQGQPTVSIQMFMRGGLSVESDQDAGISSFMARMLMKGTAKHKSAEIASMLDGMGAEMNASSGRNTVYISARCLAEDFEKTFDLAAECLLAPAFPIEELETEREQALADLAQMTDTPQGEASLYFNRVFFTDSPYKFPVMGTPGNVKNLTREKLLAWHKRYVAANNLVVAVFGGIDPAKVADRAAAALGSLPQTKDLVFPKNVAARKAPAREVYIKPTEKKGAAIVYVAYPGLDIYNVRDRFAVDCLDRILTGYDMPSGGLHEELRGRGLVYEVHAFAMEGLRPGYVAAMAICQPGRVPEVVRLIEEAFARAAAEKFTDADLAAARASIITSRQLSRETIDEAAFEAAVDEALGLEYDFPDKEIELIRQVTAADVLRVAKEYLKKPVVVVLTGDAAAAEAIRK